MTATSPSITRTPGLRLSEANVQREKSWAWKRLGPNAAPRHARSGIVAGRILALVLAGVLMSAGPKSVAAEPHELAATNRFQAVVDNAVQTTLAKFADRKLEAGQLAATLVVLRDSQPPVQASYRGNVQVYPASVVKL